jgi:hypothetical protein
MADIPEQKRKAKSQETDEPPSELLTKSESVSPRKEEQSGARKWLAKVTWRKKETATESPILTQIDEEPCKIRCTTNKIDLAY